MSDFDCDGVEDVAVGDPTASVNGRSGAGLVRVVYGGGKGSVVLHQDVDFVPDKAEAGDGFGSQLAVFDHDQDGCSDLAVGVPFEDVGTATDAGIVQTFSLLGAPGDSDHWIEAGNARGLPGTPAPHSGSATTSTRPVRTCGSVCRTVPPSAAPSTPCHGRMPWAAPATPC
ncbi:hypothetical protein ACWCRF_24470 [Streptomyces sp. NPDC002405]|uniref:hypothetical protein n=1 Tax=unclassified Streptomyces TaxID=2593676 RepID=UPI0036CEA9F6